MRRAATWARIVAEGAVFFNRKQTKALSPADSQDSACTRLTVNRTATKGRARSLRLYPEHPVSVVSPRLFAMRLRSLRSSLLLAALPLAACHNASSGPTPVAAPNFAPLVRRRSTDRRGTCGRPPIVRRSFLSFPSASCRPNRASSSASSRTTRCATAAVHTPSPAASRNIPTATMRCAPRPWRFRRSWWPRPRPTRPASS